MQSRFSTESLTRFRWLDRFGGTLQHLTRIAYNRLGTARGPVENGLRGTWLGHPVHAAITDLPIGAWTTAVMIDAIETSTGRTALQPGADAAIGIGLVGAVGAAVTGITDYQYVRKSRARRIGVVHATLNVITTGCFLASYIQRKRGSRTQGKMWAAVGLSTGMISAKLGGDLVYQEGINVATENIAGPRDVARFPGGKHVG